MYLCLLANEKVKVADLSDVTTTPKTGGHAEKVMPSILIAFSIMLLITNLAL